MFTAARVSAARSAGRRTFATAVTEAGNGVKVAAVEKASSAPTASLTVLVKAGSRFESKEGVANALKNFAFKVRCGFTLLCEDRALTGYCIRFLWRVFWVLRWDDRALLSARPWELSGRATSMVVSSRRLWEGSISR